MEETELVQKLYSCAFYAAALAVAVLSMLSGAYFILIVSAFLLLLSAVYLRSGHIVNNLLIKRSRIIEIYNGYKLNSNLSSLTKRSGAYYAGVSMALLKFEGPVEASNDSVRSMLESIQERFEFSFSAIQVDKKKLLDALETRRRMKEIGLAKLDAQKYDRSNQIKREIMVIESEMESIRRSGKAFDAVVQLKALSMAESEASAAAQSLRSMERICDAFLTATKLSYEIIKGEELLLLAGEL